MNETNYADDVLLQASTYTFNTVGNQSRTILPIIPVEQWDSLLLHARVFAYTLAAGNGPNIYLNVTWYDVYSPNAPISHTEQYGVTYRGTEPPAFDVPLQIPVRGRFVSVGIEVRKSTQTLTMAAAVEVCRREKIPPIAMNQQGMLFGTSNGGAVFTAAASPVTFFANYMYQGLVWVSGFVTQAAGSNNLLIIGELNGAAVMRRKYVIQRTNGLLVQEINFVMPYDGHEGMLNFTNFAVPAGTDWELYVYPHEGFVTR